MGNCKATSFLGHLVLDVRNTKECLDELENLLGNDLDLTENEEMFSEDTISFGYKNEADRIISYYFGIKPNKFTKDSFKIAFTDMFDYLTKDEFWGVSEVDFIDLDENRLSIAYSYGGNTD